MLRLKLIFGVFLAFLVGYLFFKVSLLEKRNIALQTQITEDKAKYEVEIARVTKEKENEVNLSKTNDEIEKSVKTDSTQFDWDFNIAGASPLLAIKRMHENRI